VPRLLAAVYDPVIHIAERRGLSRWRAEVLARARGRVLEIGAGTGLNLPRYPEAVDEIVLLEPDPHMRKRLERRASATGKRHTIVDASAVPLPFGDHEFDTVVITLVLCTVPDVTGALSEVRRVLRPGGALLFLEHVGGAEGSPRLRWQRRFEPLWRQVAGDCHLTRHTVEAIARTGFTVDWLMQEELPGLLRIGSPVVRGQASAGPTQGEGAVTVR
jgi:ubiquinone/menaquinone biosynthesis C-methylase UbiE